jgi:HAMP domain-containing protein
MILVVLLLTLYFVLRKSNPLTRLTNVVEQLTDGKPKDIELSTRKDEIGSVANAFYKLTDR